DGLVRVYDDKPDVKTFLLLRGDDRTPDKTPLPPGVPEALGGRPFAPEPVSLPKAAWSPDTRPFVVQEAVTASAEAISKAQRAWKVAQGAKFTPVAAVMQPTPLTRAMMTLVALWSVTAVDDVIALARSDLSLAQARHEALVLLLAVESLEE